MNDRQGERGLRAPGPPDGIRARLDEESGTLEWSELVRHFARGVVVVVREDVELVDAAACLAEDDAATLGDWLESGRVARASDDDARDWTAREPAFDVVVVAPWVLVRERRSG